MTFPRSWSARALVLPLALALAGACAASPAPPPPAPVATPAPPPVAVAAPPPPAPALLPGLCTISRRAPGDPVTVAWSEHPFASAFWIVDELSGWRDGQNAYIPWWREHYPSDLDGSKGLREYAALRKAHATERRAPPDVKHPENVLPPDPSPADRFAAAAFCSQGAREAALALGLTPAETSTFVAPFERLGPHLDEVLTGATYLKGARARMKELAAKADLAGFLAKAARFYGTSDAVESPLYVDVLWAPPDNNWATTMDNHMIVPISEPVAAKDRELAGWLGVVVHELGHYFEGRLPAAQKAELSDRIVGTGGLLRSRHANIVDEATAEALGNIFLETRLPEGFDADRVYTFEVDQQYPDAIDSLARAVEPRLAKLLDTPGAFSGPFLTAALEEQARLFPARLAHFAPVALVYYTDRAARRNFDGLFQGESRWSTDRAEDFAKSSEEGRTISRWALSTIGELAARRDAPAKATMPLIGEVAATVTATKALGCVGARRRPSGLGMDVAVIGRDAAGLRQAMIAVSRGMTVPGARPTCVR